MTTFDAHANFATSQVATAPTPSTTGASLIVNSGDGSKFPTPPFNCTVTNNSGLNEIIRVTTRDADTFTIVRAQEGPQAIAITVGMTIFNAETAKSFTDIEQAVTVAQTNALQPSQYPPQLYGGFIPNFSVNYNNIQQNIPSDIAYFQKWGIDGVRLGMGNVPYPWIAGINNILNTPGYQVANVQTFYEAGIWTCLTINSLAPYQNLTISGSPTGGTFTLTYVGQTTTALNWNCAASDVQSALQALSNIGSGNVVCSGGPAPGSPITITFVGTFNTYGGEALITSTNSLTGGTSPTITIANVTTLNTTNWPNFVSAVLSQLTYLQENNIICNIVEIGNELELLIDNSTINQATLIPLIQTLMEEAQAVYTLGTIGYALTSDLSPNNFTAWANAGGPPSGCMLSFHAYGSSAGHFSYNPYTFPLIASAVETLGVEKVWLSEFNVDSNNTDLIAVAPTTLASYMQALYTTYVAPLGFNRIAFFEWCETHQDVTSETGFAMFTPNGQLLPIAYTFMETLEA